MKEKNVAGILALFLGGLGVHRFYLGQTGLGVFYLIFCWFPVMWIIGLIDAIAFFSMDEQVFNRKYNRPYVKSDTDYNRRDYRRRGREERREERSAPRRGQGRYDPPPPQRQYHRPKARPPRNNPYKASGVKKFKDYDYDGAIEDFNKSLDIEPNDIATHWGLACAYSLNEKPEKSFFHLDQAVANGFNDFQRIKEKDDLAFLRIQPEFEAFEKNGFRLQRQAASAESPVKEAGEEEDILEGQPDLLEQLKRLGDLREKGLLTEEEFTTQKRKLLG